MPNKESNQDAASGAGIARTGERVDRAAVARSCRVQSGAPGRVAWVGARIATVGRTGPLGGALRGDDRVTYQVQAERGRPRQYAVRVEIYKGESR